MTEQDLAMGSCSRCFQKECARSLFGKSRFEQRTSAWRERLFEYVPRMDDSDPRLITLSKRFIEIDTSRTPEIHSTSGSWIDPRDLDVSAESPQASVFVEPVVEVEPLAPSVEETLSPPSPATTLAPSPLQPRLLNTPRQKPQMIGNRPEPPPKRDAWEVAPQETKGLPVVRPGARIKMGSGV